MTESKWRQRRVKSFSVTIDFIVLFFLFLFDSTGHSYKGSNFEDKLF